ncbi:ABC transporter permease [Humisphaera borealis]|uniref:ABC transporter permease n=1 Tax=Humisphaera borealis TaxID=2807512 RepID=A0A7M2X1K4_9BACT|nr:ABC transporter permease [Humisphaera borealis]QOV91637.1 ABC transporter permease [Humisphaera borealis]
MSPVWLTLGGLFVLPLLGIFVLSFARTGELGFAEPFEDAGQLWRHVGSGDFIDHYARSFERGPLRILLRSIWIAALTTLLCVLVAYPVAYYIAVRAPARFRSLLLMLAILPFWTSFVIRTYAWMVILRPEGLINTLLMKLGVVSEPLPLLYNELAVLFGLVYGELPFMILPLYASLEKLDRSLLEASNDLGAGGWGTFWSVTLPLSMPGLVAGSVLVFIPSVGQFVVSDMLGGSRSLLIGNLIQSQFAGHGTVGDRPFGAALAFQLSAVVLLIVWMYASWAKRRGEQVM